MTQPEVPKICQFSLEHPVQILIGAYFPTFPFMLTKVMLLKSF